MAGTLIPTLGEDLLCLVILGKVSRNMLVNIWRLWKIIQIFKLGQGCVWAKLDAHLVFHFSNKEPVRKRNRGVLGGTCTEVTE